LGILQIERYVEFINPPAMLIHRVDIPKDKYKICSSSKSLNTKLSRYALQIYDVAIDSIIVTNCDAKVTDTMTLIMKKQKNILIVLPFVKTCLVFSQQVDSKKIKNIYCSSDTEEKLANMLFPSANVIQYKGNPTQSMLNDPLNGILKYDYMDDIVQSAATLSEFSFVDFEPNKAFLEIYPMARYINVNMKTHFPDFNERFSIKSVITFNMVLEGSSTNLPQQLIENILENENIIAVNNYHTKYFNLSDITMQYLTEKNKHILMKDALPILEQYSH
jgi:hypothetical protein